MTMQGGNQISADQIPILRDVISGETSGSAAYMEINLGGIKITMVYFIEYENDTTTNQTITFPIAYTYTPEIVVGNSTLPALSATTTALTITAPDATTVYTGFALIIGM